MTTLFITGIDTDIGKTYATGILARHLLSSGKSVITQKLIQTGVTAPIADDIRTHRTLMNVPLMDVDTDGTTCPLTFVKPASPHLSARLENRTINLDDITHATDKLNERFNIVLLEGAGGVLVPINDHILTLDYIATHDYPVIVVTSARLGSINHTLLTLEAIHARGLRLFAVVFNHHFDTDGDISADTLNFLQNHVRENYPTALFLRLDGGQIMAFDKVTDRF